MLNLIIKDIRINRGYLIAALTFLFFVSTQFIFIVLKEQGKNDPEIVFYSITVFLTCSLSSSLFLIVDEVYKVSEVFASLPISRKQMVLSKYIIAYLLIGITLLIHFLGAHFALFLFGSKDYQTISLINSPGLWIGLFITLLISKALAHPFYFKFDMAKGSAIYSSIAFLLFAFTTISFRLLMPHNSIQLLVEWIQRQNELLILMTLLVAFLTLITTSVLLSIKFYKKRDL